jgi:tRNA A37 threonylcarbamoyladenosine modification protein TsaB
MITLSFNVLFSGVDIILQNNDKIICKKNFISSKQSEILIKSIEETLKANDIKYDDIDIFTTINGPGNFTGIKINLATLKALKMSTNAKIITLNIFEIISLNVLYDKIILDINKLKYYIKCHNNNYFVILKDNIDNFINKNEKIITNSQILAEKYNLKYSNIDIDNWINSINFKIKNKIFSEEIEPLYIETASITERKK